MASLPASAGQHLRCAAAVLILPRSGMRQWGCSCSCSTTPFLVVSPAACVCACCAGLRPAAELPGAPAASRASGPRGRARRRQLRGRRGALREHEGAVPPTSALCILLVSFSYMRFLVSASARRDADRCRLASIPHHHTAARGHAYRCPGGPTAMERTSCCPGCRCLMEVYTPQ